MLETAGLSKEWWGEAILTASYVLNRVPTKNKEITPFEEWKKKKIKSLLSAYLGLFGKSERANKQEAKGWTKKYGLCLPWLCHTQCWL
jgi:hypothetical protein